MKQKTCKNKNCKKKFIPEREFQNVCDYKCAIEYSKQLKEKKDAKKKTENRVALREFKNNDKPILLQLAQKLVNQYIRARDKGLNCISCDHNFANGRVENAGHFVRVSKSSFLRFNEDNIHLQCSYCNKELEGNEGAYKIKLTEKIGAERVRYLDENRSTLKRWTVKEYQEIITTYRKKLKELLNG